MKDEIVQIQWTCANFEEAKKISSSLVQEGLVACANLIPNIESIYIWQGQLETSKEVKVLLKTRKKQFEAVQAYIKSHCSYEVPEISMIAFSKGNPSYFHWVLDQVK
jgi:periplasmic divalent cation tolerance protein